MADILIRGVEMPNSCEKCPFNDYEQGFCFAAWKFNESGWPDFSLNVGCQETRNHRCPLVPLPEGHGRLGDLDALQEEFKKSHDGKKLMLIDTAPTIIEADLEWKMNNCCCFSNTDHAEGGTGDADPAD
jgi:hypothetical protein